MAGPDLSLITNAPNLTDRINQQSAITSQLQAQQVDVRQKQNAYATQVMSAAAASGDPTQYARGKQLLASQGIDVSNWSDDPVVGAQQAQAARQALISPSGLMNAEIQMQRNGIQAAGVNGTPAPTGTPSLIGGGSAAPTATAAPSLGTPIPSSAPAANIPVFQQSASGQPPSLASPVTAAPADSTATPNPSAGPPQPQRSAFNDPAKNPKQNQQDWQDAFDAWKADPRVQQASKAAEALGTQTGPLPVKAAEAQQGFDLVDKNLQTLRDLTSQVPQQGMVLSAEDQAGLSQRLGTTGPLNYMFGDNQKAANNQATFDTANQAQTIGAIRELAASGQIKMSRTLENILNKGYLVDPNMSPTAKTNQINVIEAELKNGAINAQNVNAQMNGGTQIPYSNVPNGLPPAAAPASTGWSIQKVN